MKNLLFLFMCFVAVESYAQTVVFDKAHFSIVNANAAVRNASEIGYHQTLNIIRQNTDDIILNSSSLALVQTMIVNSLTQINEGFKDAIQVRMIAETVLDISTISAEAFRLAGDNPILFLFVEEYTAQAKKRSLNLATEVSSLILNEGDNLLMNYNVRDELLDSVQKELRVILALVLAAKNSIYWAKTNGIIRSLNPYQAYINRDLGLINEIIIKQKILTR
ncbi:hypothetical protein CLV31_101119 [Algoriphagus aquaeductus]|uniref:PilJ/NarX-like methyl-accepting chemotaxis transducer n=1 Tax=Algoriphagus aquaeductus TaxID=475299 RepID=A0A326S0X4_9BACT|nr:hypothetical protein [Algoriphagus aquaeductus]PZV87247.1 hypothetical protein CLV31_101119 [Algoriphagus aquaeductus]